MRSAGVDAPERPARVRNFVTQRLLLTGPNDDAVSVPPESVA
jgi:hypothetical protein